MSISIEQFARWSFERDVAVGCYNEPGDARSWGELTSHEQSTYLTEADHYLGKSRTEWPEDILDRLVAPPSA